MASVERAAQLLLIISEMPGSGVTELAAATGMTKSLTFRLLYTLESQGLVRKNAERRTYALGYSALILGERARRQSPLMATAEEVLAALSSKTRENALLLVRDGLSSMCIAMKESPQPLRIFAAVGRAGPLHAGGGPKVLLAFAPEDVRATVLSGPLEAFTDQTIVAPEALEASLARIRRDGQTLSVGELDPNTFSIAAPVRDHSGTVVAALSVNGPTARLDPASEPVFLSEVLDHAVQLSRQLGWAGHDAAVLR
ncbi:MAG: IclR family transcriptional regulator [Pseudomonadota bacterium]